MTTDTIAAPKRSGLAVLLDLILAPGAAFAELNLRAHWGWALLLTCACGMVGAYLQIPAGEHVASYTIAHDPQFASFTSEQLDRARATTMAVQRYVWVFYPLIAAIAFAVTALCALVANAIGRGHANFARCFGLAANVGFLYFGLGYLLHGAIVAFRGPDGFQTQLDLLRVLPGLGWFTAALPLKAQAFFTTFNVFEIWSTALLALGLRAISGISAPLAWGTAIFIALCSSVPGVLAAH